MHLFDKPLTLILFFLSLIAFSAAAQKTDNIYSGVRISVFDFKVLSIRGKTVLLKCRVANTGRVAVASKKNISQRIIELDTANIPAILWGHEAALSEAVAASIPKLEPGEISPPVWLKVTVHAPDDASLVTSGGCPDLIFDTAFITQYSDAEITLRYELRNIGTAPVAVASKSFQLPVNVYYISGTKLTRGAILAGNAYIYVGRETLTGWLEPRQKLSGTVTIDLKTRTKFAPNLLLELAPPSTLMECDRTNNTRCVAVRY